MHPEDPRSDARSKHEAMETTALLEASRAILKHRHFQDAARAIFDAAKHLIGAASGYVALLSEDGAENEVLFLDAGGRPCSVDPALPMPIRGLRAQAYRNRRTVYDNRFSQSRWMEFMPAGHVELGNVMFAPLILDGKATGLMGLANKPGGFTERDAGLATAFAEFAAVALNNSRMLEALQESRELSRSVIETAKDGIISIDATGRILAWNKAAERIFGYSEPEMLDGILTRIIPDEHRKAHEAALKRIGSGGKPSRMGETLEIAGIAKDGRKVPLELSLDAGATKAGFIFTGILRDITERKQAEKERIELEKQLRQAQKLEAVGTLAGGIAHDFNNILGIILGNADLAADDVPEWNPASVNLQEIRKASLRARDVVRQLLSFSRNMEIEKRPVDIGPVIRESLKLLRSSIPTSIDIRQSIPEGVDTILADPTQIHQLLINLATNAAHAMEDRGGVLEIDLSNRRIDCHTAPGSPDLPPGGYVRLVVSDTGCGIDPKHMDRIFDPYFTTKRTGKGGGMGLSVVHGIVKNHGGAISVESTLGKGTAFCLWFPVAAKGEIEDPTPGGTLPVGKECILLVDDEPSIIDMGGKLLEKMGYRIVGKTDPFEAFVSFSENPGRFDFAVLDMTMPKMTGDQLAKKMLDIRPDLPIIVCTGFSERIDARRAKALGICGLMMKPVSFREIAQTVRQVLDEKQR